MDKAKAAGVDVECHVADGMPHVHPLFAALAAEDAAAVATHSLHSTWQDVWLYHAQSFIAFARDRWRPAAGVTARTVTATTTGDMDTTTMTAMSVQQCVRSKRLESRGWDDGSG